MYLSFIDNLKMQLAESLQRKASTTCSRWAENYLVLGKPVPGPLRFAHHPWSRPWYDHNLDWRGKKAAQMAMTQAALARAIYTVDILRNDVLYILPKLKDASDFSKSKFDILLENSRHINNLFSNVRNIGHKQAGSTNLYIRGTRSRSALKSISTGLMIYDELDEMNQDNLKLAEQRTSGYQSQDIQEIKLSTPTFPDFGITKEFEPTDQRHYFFRCPNCSRLTELLDLNNLVICTDNPNDIAGLNRSHLICTECKHPLPHDDDPQLNIKVKQSWINESNCQWQATRKSDLTGFWIPQLYSIVKPIAKIAKTVIEAQTDQFAKIELHNSILAKEFVPEGARIEESEIRACQDSHRNGSVAPKSKLITMGIDVGHKVLYYHIDEWLVDPQMVGPNINVNAIPRSINIGVVPGFYHIEQLIYNYQVRFTVIDVDPAQREALNLAEKFEGHVKLCRFVRGIKLRSIQNEDPLIIQVNRTVWLDTSQQRYRRSKRGIILPVNLPDHYYKHVSALIKNQKKDDDGNIIAKYISTGDDHYAFARVYSEIALPHAVSGLENKNIESFL